MITYRRPRYRRPVRESRTLVGSLRRAIEVAPPGPAVDYAALGYRAAQSAN